MSETARTTRLEAREVASNLGVWIVRQDEQSSRSELERGCNGGVSHGCKHSEMKWHSPYPSTELLIEEMEGKNKNPQNLETVCQGGKGGKSKYPTFRKLGKIVHS